MLIEVQLFTDGLPEGQPHISELLASDILHQGNKGGFMDHYVTWVGEYVMLVFGKQEGKRVMDEIDRRFVFFNRVVCCSHKRNDVGCVHHLYMQTCDASRKGGASSNGRAMTPKPWAR
jgi:hypothetical protein